MCSFHAVCLATVERTDLNQKQNTDFCPAIVLRDLNQRFIDALYGNVEKTSMAHKICKKRIKTELVAEGTRLLELVVANA